jgi:hypothetical protein
MTGARSSVPSVAARRLNSSGRHFSRRLPKRLDASPTRKNIATADYEGSSKVSLSSLAAFQALLDNLPLKTTSYAACSRYFRAVRGNFTLESAVGLMPKAVIRLGVYGLSADLVAFNDGTHARPARVTFAGFLDSNRSCRPADIGLRRSRDFNRESN